jgi:hypothetical protein
MKAVIVLTLLLAMGGLAALPVAEAHEYVCIPGKGCREVSNLDSDCYVYVGGPWQSLCYD